MSMTRCRRVFSPDGSRLAVTARHSDARRGYGHRHCAAPGGETKGVVTLFTGTDLNPVTGARIGRYLYLGSCDRGGSMNLWHMPMDMLSGQAQGEPEPVTTPSTFAARPSISSDGRLVTFSSVTNTTNVQAQAQASTRRARPSGRVSLGRERPDRGDGVAESIGRMAEWVTLYLGRGTGELVHCAGRRHV